MRVVQGTVNDGIYASFSVQSTTELHLTGEKSLLKDRRETHLGFFRAMNKDIETTEKVYINFTDFTNKIQVIVEENPTYPKIRISHKLSNPDKYNVSEFFVSGHFKVIAVNVLSAERTFKGEQLNDPLKQRKDVKVLDRLLFSWESDPKLKVKETETPFGNIVSVASNTYLEI